MRTQDVKLALLAAFFGLSTAAPVGVSQDSVEMRTTEVEPPYPALYRASKKEGDVEKRLVPPYHDLYRGVYGSGFDIAERDAEKRAEPVEPPYPALYRASKKEGDVDIAQREAEKRAEPVEPPYPALYRASKKKGDVEKRLEPPPYHDLYRGVYGSDFDIAQRDVKKRAEPVEPPYPALYRASKTEREPPLPTPKYGDLYRSIAVEEREVEPPYPALYRASKKEGDIDIAQRDAEKRAEPKEGDVEEREVEPPYPALYRASKKEGEADS
ncbi:hypothetical protein HD806DRAFT_548394 [Xylariaceae sp. AK1471]|nr:hypothetical protein HD806DRAFT_548394 [Xylariaceae sp. AK1471]